MHSLRGLNSLYSIYLGDKPIYDEDILPECVYYIDIVNMTIGWLSLGSQCIRVLPAVPTFTVYKHLMEIREIMGLDNTQL